MASCVGLQFQIFQIEDAFGEAAKKSGHAVFQHSPARAEQRRAGDKLLAERDQVVLIAAGSVQEQQSDLGPVGKRARRNGE